MRKYLKNHDDVVTDGAVAITSAAVMVSDLVWIPVTPSLLDFAAYATILAVVEARKNLQPVIARFVIA